ncbi:nitroreductase [Chloroflexota bacterium]
MELFEAIRNRKSSRAFNNNPVPKDLIEEILRLAINAPSSNNLQPWEFVIVMEQEKDRLSRLLMKSYKEKQISCGSGAVKTLPETIRHRGIQTLESMGKYVDRIGVSTDSFINEGSCNFYGAPVAILICLDDCFSTRQMVDVGTVVGYLLLTAHAFGLATCPIGLIAEYGDEIKELLNISDNKKVVIGIALGYPNQENPISEFRSSRAELSELSRWI